jgi:serpin B
MRTIIYLTVFSICSLATLNLATCANADSTNRSNQTVQTSPSVAPTAASEATPEEAVQPAGANKMETRLAAADNEFGFNLFSQIQTKDKDKNIFISPLSVAFALAMTYNGAAGETQPAMARALKLERMSLAEINQASAALTKTLISSDPKVEMVIANSLWARQGVTFKPDFLARNRQFFGAEITSLNFGSPQAKNTINNWVSRKTRGKIPAIIDQIDAQKVLFLINAIYFKGQWQKRFDKTLTNNEPFHLLSGAQKQVPMMSQSGSYRYFRGDKFQAISLPYGNGGTSLYLFLPDQDSSLKSVLNSLNYQTWEQWMGRFRDTPGDVKIPRFKLDYEINLNEPLKALGMEVAFIAGKADFSGMRAQRDLFISEVKHKAIVELNEEGTTAAAATSVGIGVTSVRPEPQRFTFIADRPFLMAIRNQQNGAILFIGAVVEPK